MKKLVTLVEGDIIAIPLFTADVPSIQSFKKDDLSNKGKAFAFCRVIADKEGAGYIIEVFDLMGTIDQDMPSIISAKRLFNPVVISGLGILKKRWRKIHTHPGYDKEKDSGYAGIRFVLGAADDVRLWQNNEEKKISPAEANQYEPWRIWLPGQLEKRIIAALFN